MGVESKKREEIKKRRITKRYLAGKKASRVLITVIYKTRQVRITQDGMLVYSQKQSVQDKRGQNARQQQDKYDLVDCVSGCL